MDEYLPGLLFVNLLLLLFKRKLLRRQNDNGILSEYRPITNENNNKPTPIVSSVDSITCFLKGIKISIQRFDCLAAVLRCTKVCN